LTTRFLRVRAEPRPRTVAISQRQILKLHRLDHVSFGSAFAPSEPRRKIAAGPTFIHPQRTGTIRRTSVDEGAPVNIGDVTGPTSPNKANRNHRPFLFVFVNEPVFGKGFAVDESARPRCRPVGPNDILRNEPL